MQKICNLLAEHNNRVYLICRESGGISKNLFDSRIHFFQLSSNSLISKIKEIRKIMKDIRPDYVHVQGLFKDAFIPGLYVNRRYKYFITIWGSDLNLFSKNYLNRIFQNIALLLCDKLHLLSAYIGRQVRRTYFGINPKKIVVFSWGIDFYTFQNPDPVVMQNIYKELQISPSDPVVLSYRNHKPLYNHHTIVESIVSVKKSIPNVKYIFTRGSADADYIQKTLELVRKYNLAENFRFIDRWLSDRELSALVNLAGICISIPFNDGQPATLFEIMATKAVPIISRLENFRPFFKNVVNGFYLNRINDSDELAKTIIMVIKHYPEISQSIYKINNQYILRYQDWSRNLKMQVEMYN